MQSPKAQVTADMAIALVIFVTMVSVAFYYMSYLSKPKQPFEATIQAQGFSIAEALSKNVSWTIYKSPVLVTSNNASFAAFEPYFRPGSGVDITSIAVLDSNSNSIPFGFSENTLVWTANITSGKNLFYITYSKNTSLPALSYSTDLNSAGLSVNNSLIRVLFSSAGISSIIFDGTEIAPGGIALGTSGVLENNALPTRAKLNYPNGVSAKIYNNKSKILIQSNTSFNAVLNLSAAFISYYNGTANAFSSGGEQFNSILNFTDVYSSSRGVSVIGDNINISIANTSYREVRLYNVTEFEIYLHSGDYSTALVEKDMYLNPPSIIIGLPLQLSGVSTDKIDSLSATPYSSLKSALSGSVNFNLTLEGMNKSLGKPMPSDRDVMVVRYPAMILGRLANTTETYFTSTVWMGGDYE